MITLDAVTKRYGDGEVAVESLSLEIGDGELCVLVGPSGCGKTTTLRMINRLIEPSDGRILIDGRNVLEMNPVELRRGIGYVIQQGGSSRTGGWGQRRRRAAAARLGGHPGPGPDHRTARAGWLDRPAMPVRSPTSSRVANASEVGVARALGGDPPVMLMDEPSEP